MSKRKYNRNASFYRERANELRELIKALQAFFEGSYVVLDTLQAAAKEMDNIAESNKTENEWNFSISNLIIPMGDIRNIEPKGIQAKICISCLFKTTVEAWNNALSDPFNTYSFQLRVYGDYKGIQYSWGMHIDKENSSQVEEWHPLYHLHCFESRITSPSVLVDPDQKKGTLLLNVPRMVHYPLDIMLGVGFCLVNFYKKDAFTSFCTRGDSHFLRFYKKSQDRILKPYFESLAANISDCVFQKKALCPQII